MFLAVYIPSAVRETGGPARDDGLEWFRSAIAKKFVGLMKCGFPGSPLELLKKHLNIDLTQVSTLPSVFAVTERELAAFEETANNL